MADEDSGESFMQKHMSEAQPSAAPGGYGNSPRAKLRGYTDSQLEQHYGKEVDLMPATPQTVNRSGKGRRG